MSVLERAPIPKKGAHLYKHGLVSHPLYGRWRRMIQRCEDPKAKDFRHYGGRGITVCERWRNSFEAFLSDMGDPPPGARLDRVDNNKGYSPDNCRWVNQSEQMKNTRVANLITYNGVTKNLVDWAAEVGVAQATLKYRMKHWPMDRAMTKGKFKTNGVKA